MKIKFNGDWKPLFPPTKFCKYVNDHTIFTDVNGDWRLIGTCGDTYSLFSESCFVEGVSTHLEKPMKETRTLFKSEVYTGPKIAPFCFYDKKSQKYHLYYAPMVIRHYESKDGITWQKVQDAIRSMRPILRDPHVISIADYYLMYLTDAGNMISVYKSFDLHSWKKLSIVYRVPDTYPKSFNSSCESPFILKINNGYLLFVTIVPGRYQKEANLKYYNNTVVYFSKDPLNFTEEVGRLDAHAGEIVQNNGKYFLTTCGWKDFPKPVGVNGEGVFIRELSI